MGAVALGTASLSAPVRFGGDAEAGPGGQVACLVELLTSTGTVAGLESGRH